MLYKEGTEGRQVSSRPPVTTTVVRDNTVTKENRQHLVARLRDMRSSTKRRRQQGMLLLQ